MGTYGGRASEILHRLMVNIPCFEKVWVSVILLAQDFAGPSTVCEEQRDLCVIS